MRADEPRGVRVALPPPLLCLLVLGGGLGLGHWWALPLPGIPAGLRLSAAGGMLVIAFGLGGWALWTLRRLKASPEFQRPVCTLVQEGPYRFTRNPLYVALSALLVAFAGLLDNLWVLAGLPVLVILLDRLVIAREEIYLRVRFGTAYEEYARKVRRWL